MDTADPAPPPTSAIHIQADALQQVAQMLNADFDLEQVLQVLLEQLARVVTYDSASVMLVAGEQLRIVAHRGFQAAEYQAQVAGAELAHIQQVLAQRRPLIIRDTYADPRWRAVLGGQYIRCWLGAPLLVKDQVLGVLNLDKAQAGFYTPHHAHQAWAFARLAALALENARLFAEQQRRDAILDVLAYAAENLLLSDDVGQVLPQVLSQLGRAVDASRAFVYRMHLDAQGALLESMIHEWCAPDITPQINNPDNQASPVAGLFRDWINAMRGDQVWQAITRELTPTQRVFLEKQDICSIVEVPILIEGEWWGYLGFDDCRHERRWSAAEIDAFRNISRTLSAAVIHQRNTQAEREQRTLVEALHDTAAALTSTLNLDEVLSRILENIDRVVPHDTANIMLMEGQQAYVARARGFEAHGLGEWILHLRLSLAWTTNLNHMAQTGQPLLIPNTALEPTWVDIVETRWVKSYVGAPIQWQGTTLGFLNLDHAQPNFYTSAHAQRLLAFANQSAVAIANARLYEAAHQHSRQMATLNAITHAALEARDIETLTHSIVERLSDLFSADYCLITFWDEAQQQTLPVAASGDLHLTYTTVRLPAGEATYTAQALKAGHALVVDNAYGTISPYVRAQMPPVFQNVRAGLVLPLVAAAEKLGAVLIAFHQPRSFSAEEIALGEQAARQIALAIAKTQLVARLEAARKAAEEANRLKGEFLANTSHELRTPLTSILGVINLILEGGYEHVFEVQELLSIAQSASQTLLGIINDVLDVAKIEAGKMELNAHPMDVVDILTEVYNLTRIPAENKHLHLEVEPPAETPAVYADPDKVRQILLNLVGNAIKFTEAGEVRLQAQPDWPAREMVIRVQDTGIGIPPEKQAGLFQPFVQVDGSLTRKYGGTGLGLSISRQLAHLMHGELALFSAGAGQGSTFTLRLPLVV